MNYNIFIIYISFISLLFHYIDYIYINNFVFFIIFRIYFSHNFQSTYIPYKFSKTSLTQKNNVEFLAQISFRKIFLPITMRTRYSELRTNKIINQCILEFIIYIHFFFHIRIYRIIKHHIIIHRINTHQIIIYHGQLYTTQQFRYQYK